MRIGLQIPRFTWPEGIAGISKRMRQIASLADEGGFYSLWVMDHFFQIRGVGEVDEPMLEGYTTLGTLATATERVKLGTLVAGVIYRYPGLLVKQVTTLDVLSGGRAYFGIGAAWFEREAKGLGVPFPSTAVRFELLEEALQITKQMWSEDDGPYHGKHNHLEQTLCVPQPLSQPHPPIMVGGQGERKTLRMVAQYGDACNLFARTGHETLRRKLDVLQAHCEDLGREYDSIEKTALSTVHLGEGKATAAEVVDDLTQLAALGFDQVIFNMPNIHELKPIETFAEEIIPAVAG